MFILLPETAAIYRVWEALVMQHAVSGKAAHDARLVAGMQVHGLRSVLTFDQSGFKRFPGVDVIHPSVPAMREGTSTESPDSPSSR